jgi:hypothetical protein
MLRNHHGKRPTWLDLNFSQTPWVSDGPVVKYQSVTNDGCPISARFWQMWDSTNLGPWVYRVQMIVDMKTVASRE